MNIRHILVAEDNLLDEKLTMTALAEYNPANKVVAVRDGADALDYLYWRGKFKTRPLGNLVTVFMDRKMPKISGMEVLTMKAAEHLKMIPTLTLPSSREEPDAEPGKSRSFDFKR